MNTNFSAHKYLLENDEQNHALVCVSAFGKKETELSNIAITKKLKYPQAQFSET